jgi:phosphoglycerate dehydrogenase-like enzyme
MRSLFLALTLAGALAAQTQKKIVVFGSNPDMLRDLQSVTSAATVVGATADNASAVVADADGIIAPPGAQVFKNAPNLKWVQTQSAGVENFVNDLRDRPVILTNCKIIQGPNIADHAMALLLTMTRQIPTALGFMRSEEWGRGRFQLYELAGKTAVIIGVGGIGMQIAQRAHGFGMNVIGVDPKDISYTYFLKKVVRPEQLDTVLPEADVVFVSAPLTNESRGMVGERQFSLMKKNTFFVAVSRGGLYDTPALVKALDSKHLAGAGLDVTNPEPLPKGHPLWKFDNVIITPHVAGGSDQVGGRRLAVYKENIRRFVNGEPMLNVVDKVKGY